MVLKLSNLAISRGMNSPGDSLRSYLVRYRFALYLLPMMFRCMSCVTRGSTEGAATADKTLPSSTS